MPSESNSQSAFTRRSAISRPPPSLIRVAVPIACGPTVDLKKDWLRGLDSNQDNQIQSLVCCQLHHPGVVESKYFTGVLRSLQPKLSLNLCGSQAERPCTRRKTTGQG